MAGPHHDGRSTVVSSSPKISPELEYGVRSELANDLRRQVDDSVGGVHIFPHEAAWSLLEQNRDRGEEVALNPIVVGVDGKLALPMMLGAIADGGHGDQEVRARWRRRRHTVTR
jgi:hypothetical protein